MAFRRTASALVSRTDVPFESWVEEYRRLHEPAVASNRLNRIAREVLRKCDPKQFLLSHATIVASVDTYAPRGSRTGIQTLQGCQIDVRFPSYRIKPECQKIINNNGDAWERGLLLSTYKTFIGAHNYLEHIQVPELSKGFIVDAIARDLGETCYIDILVATDRKHRVLVQDILSGKMDSMSMGCISLFTVCSRCGNVASDDTQLCPHVLYDGKGSSYADEDGVEHKLAELIGHVSVAESNQFIEASWVRNPAFTGAVRRNILNQETSAVAAKLDQAAEVYEIRRSMDPIEGLSKVAHRLAAEGDDPGPEPTPDPGSDSPDAMDAAMDSPDEGESEPKAGDDKPAAESPAADRLNELVQKAQELLLEGLVSGLSEKLAPKAEDVGTAVPGLSSGANLNETLLSFDRAVSRIYPDRPEIRSFAASAMRAVAAGPAGIARANLTAKDLIVLSWIRDAAKAEERPAPLYKAAMTVGPVSAFPSERSYLAACGMKVGRQLTTEESGFFIRLGRLASLSNKF